MSNNPTGKGLKPVQPGEVRNPKGKPKGTIDMATRIRSLLGDNIDWNKVTIKDTAQLQERYGKVTVAEALIYVQVSKALTGDTQAFNALREGGWGRMINFEGKAELEVTHIYKPEKLEKIQLESMAEQLRERANKAVEGEILDEVDSPTGSANLRPFDT